MQRETKTDSALSNRVEDGMDLEVVDFSDLEQIEESIAPIFLIVPTGGTCTGSSGSGCICHTG